MPFGTGETANGKLVVVSLPAFLTMTRKPPPGFAMQSNGLLLPPFPADGYEHTFTSTPPLSRILGMLTWSVTSFGESEPAGAKGSVSVIRFPFRSVPPDPIVPAVIPGAMIGADGWLQRSFFASSHEKNKGESAVRFAWVAIAPDSRSAHRRRS